MVPGRVLPTQLGVLSSHLWDSESRYGQPTGNVLGSHGASWFLQAVVTALLLLGGDLGASPYLEGKAA